MILSGNNLKLLEFWKFGKREAGKMFKLKKFRLTYGAVFKTSYGKKFSN